MNTQTNTTDSLEDAQGRNPIEFPFGFYIEDNHGDSSGGSFFWYNTEKEMQYAIQNDLIDALSEGNSDDIKLVKAEIANLMEKSTPHIADDDHLLDSLNTFLGEIELRLQFLGSYEDLCKNKNEWSKYLREEFREEYLEDIEDFSSKKLQSSIKKSEQDDFAEFVSDYLI
ncbi:MAG: hypothetical protein ACXVA2_21700 [Mucilaginibacter sp.]